MVNIKLICILVLVWIIKYFKFLDEFIYLFIIVLIGVIEMVICKFEVKVGKVVGNCILSNKCKGEMLKVFVKLSYVCGVLCSLL